MRRWTLRFVITHSPGIEHDYVVSINENNDNYLLFDDLIQTDKARDEHRQLYNILITLQMEIVLNL